MHVPNLFSFFLEGFLHEVTHSKLFIHFLQQTSLHNTHHSTTTTTMHPWGGGSIHTYPLLSQLFLFLYLSHSQHPLRSAFFFLIFFCQTLHRTMGKEKVKCEVIKKIKQQYLPQLLHYLPCLLHHLHFFLQLQER